MVEQALNLIQVTARELGRSSNRLAGFVRDRVVWAMVLVLLLVALSDPDQVNTSLRFTLESIWGMLPFFLLAIGFAAIARSTGADQLVARVFSGNPLRSTILAALVGALSPFCSCGVIPLIAAMLGAGVPLAPVMAFWIASPIMDPEMFVLTAAGIGVNFALFKTLAAITMGLVAGGTVLLMTRQGLLTDPLQTAVTSGCASTCTPDRRAVYWRFWNDPSRMQVFRSEAGSIGLFLGKWLTLAFLLESLMVAYVPSQWIVSYAGPDNALAIPLAVLVGVPSYLNGYAAIPLVSGLLEMGMTPGAAMGFVTAGAVSCVPAAIAVFALVKRPVFLLYLFLGLAGSMLCAWLYQLSGGAL